MEDKERERWALQSNSELISAPILALLLAACGGGGGGGGGSSPGGTGGPRGAGGGGVGVVPPPVAQPRTFTGRVYDGPVKDATVYIDVNGNGRVDSADMRLATTDNLGAFTATIPAEHSDKELIVDLTGAVDIGDNIYRSEDDSQPFTGGVWLAPAGSEVISPLTDLLVEEELTPAQLRSQMRLSLPEDVDVTNFDPLDTSPHSAQVLAVARHVVNNEQGAIELRIYENHPINKALYDAGEGGSFTLSGDDKDLFRIDTDGQLWWKTPPDFEDPQDENTDNEYIVTITHRVGGQTEITPLMIDVGDLERELTPAEIASQARLTRHFVPRDFSAEELPSDFTQHIIGGYAYKVPATGPAIITWSLVLPTTDSDSILTDQTNIERGRKAAEDAFAEFEAVANLQFVEVRGDATRIGDIKILFTAFGFGSGEAGTHYGVGLATDRHGTIVHELGHILGLDHPHEANDWPGNPQYDGSFQTIMGNSGRLPPLSPADIEALQWLYGAPDTNFEGVESLLL